MAEPESGSGAGKPRRWLVARNAGLLAIAYAIPIAISRARLLEAVWNALQTEFGSSPKTLQQVQRLVEMIWFHASVSYGGALFIASLALPLGFLVRTLARARVRAGLPDPLDRARGWLARHPRGKQALFFAPALVGAFVFLALFEGFFRWVPSDRAGEIWTALVPGFLLPAGVSLLAHVALVRRGVAALLAPTLAEDETARAEVQADGFTFDAVAVTRETQGAVAGVAGLSLVMTLAALYLPVTTLAHDPRFVTALVAYLAVAGGGAVLFRRASRVAVGLDGLRIQGTSRTRFFAYRDVDGARVKGSDIELVRGTRVVVRLQLHGKDAARRDALVARLQASITRAADEREQPAASFVASASSAQLTQAAHGAGDYRQAALTREQLWELVEGPTIATSSRAAAAEALAMSTDPAERTRLRVAADQFAEPAVRARIQALVGADDDEGKHDEEPAEAPALRRASLAP